MLEFRALGVPRLAFFKDGGHLHILGPVQVRTPSASVWRCSVLVLSPHLISKEVK